ncbi:16S rRNA (uracil(1498)-N(3))-methyltransferase [Candidatus Omnitrophota bacterium]
MSRFYVPPSRVGEKEIVIDGKEAHHILDVMRMQDGDKVIVFDGTGNEYVGFIKNSNQMMRRLIVEIIRTQKPSSVHVPEITLVQAIPKKGKMDYIVEKATELGVSKIIPIISNRTIVRPDDKGCGKKVERWRKIAVEASKQCGRTDVPDIDEVTEYRNILEGADQYDLILFACLTDRTIPLKNSFKGFNTGKILVFIGPEGDFTPEEIKMADIENCKFVSLGKRVLRSDTAGLFLLSVLDYEFSV